MQRMQHQERPSVRRAGPGAPGQALRSNVWAAILTFFVSSQKMCWTINSQATIFVEVFSPLWQTWPNYNFLLHYQEES
jgi:hypothetical protein